VNESSENAGIRTLTSGELVSGVVGKHRRFLEEYRKEFEELENRLNEIEGEVKNSKNFRSQMLERKEVLKEKRQQFYHQVEGLLEKELFPKIDQISTNKLLEDIKKLKAQIEPGEEQEFAGAFIGSFQEASRKADLEESIVQQVGVKIEEAKNSNQELKKIEESEKQLEESHGSKSEELSKGKPQHKLLKSKIKSHEEALKYWETLAV
jgi:DNA-binding helix-hairpin-helix protein with protein kinase domain